MPFSAWIQHSNLLMVFGWQTQDTRTRHLSIWKENIQNYLGPATGTSARREKAIVVSQERQLYRNQSVVPPSGTDGVLRGSVGTSTAFVSLCPNRTTRTSNQAQLAIRPHRGLIREGQNNRNLRSLLNVFLMLTHQPKKLLYLPYAYQKVVEAHSGR